MPLRCLACEEEADQQIAGEPALERLIQRPTKPSTRHAIPGLEDEEPELVWSHEDADRQAEQVLPAPVRDAAVEQRRLQAAEERDERAASLSTQQAQL